MNGGPAPLAGRLCTSGPEKKVCAIFSHGLFSTKDGYKITRLAEKITSSGADLITFDFYCCGESGGNISELSVSREMQDLSAVIDHASALGYTAVHLIGSSMGAAVSLLCRGTKFRSSEFIKSLILIAAPYDLEALIHHNIGTAFNESLDPEGFTGIQGIPIRNRFFSEVKEINPAKLISSIDIPVLCIHGGLDEIVPRKNAEIINSISPPGSRLVIIPGGDHNLTAENHLAIIGDEISDWLEKFPEK